LFRLLCRIVSVEHHERVEERHLHDLRDLHQR
jgi:hypothetical protein